MSIPQESENTESEDAAKKKLDELLQAGDEKGRLLAQAGRELTQEGQTISDVAKATRSVLNYTRHVPNVEGLIVQWEANNQQADLALGEVRGVLVPPLISGSSTAIYSSTGFLGQPEIYLDVAEEFHAPLSQAITVLSETLARPAHRDEVITLMTTLGLDSPQPGQKSAVELFSTAHQAFASPVADSDPAITSLLPMRESIWLVIESLLKRRPHQEKAGNARDKILSIGKQLAYSSLSPQQIKTWADTWYSQLDSDLSPAKHAAISRDEWQKRLTRSTLFLRSFLSGIDPAKLRA